MYKRQILVYANEDGHTQAFLVPAGTPGLSVDRRNKLMGVKALSTNFVTLADCRVPAENRLGGEVGIDFSLILNHSRVALGAAAVSYTHLLLLDHGLEEIYVICTHGLFLRGALERLSDCLLYTSRCV